MHEGGINHFKGDMRAMPIVHEKDWFVVVSVSLCCWNKAFGEPFDANIVIGPPIHSRRDPGPELVTLVKVTFKKIYLHYIILFIKSLLAHFHS